MIHIHRGQCFPHKHIRVEFQLKHRYIMVWGKHNYWLIHW